MWLELFASLFDLLYFLTLIYCSFASAGESPRHAINMLFLDFSLKF